MSADAKGLVSPGEVVPLPREPYPGLRPFLNHESSLLLGRDRQVREVIDRLKETQFVAVIGGSGSGKSSLVLAGVVPELRSFGIPEAGDFWLPMTCTPGTNVSKADAAAARNTPVTRLAWKFSKLLKPAASAEAEAARRDMIASVFRQEAGFARLVDTFAEDLLVRPGPEPKDVRLLFVIDQFEELFHPTNKDVEDARLLVERVIDHFFGPHPRCYVVLTMRSEHLNDCAGYLELPDAINKSSYLVRRLDEAELREAIVGPSQRYLRLLQRRDAGAAPPLPAEVAFEPRVVDRLMRDVSAITHDPDHLPLLQHLLARIWEAAFVREGIEGGVPSKIVWTDLERAVQAPLPAGGLPAPGGMRLPFDAPTNALRASLENWAEAVYARHAPEQRAELDSVLRRLAFKDPNTGMYTQQRIDVDDPTLFGGAPNPRQHLRALIEDGFVGSVDYLFWDDENPERVTLKVSHESFIRGWSRFRRWADEEDRQFQVYLRLLDDCARWVSAGRVDKALSTGETLRVYQGAGLDTALADPEVVARFTRLLAMDRDGHRVAPMAGEALAFLRDSRANRDQRAADRERADAQQRADREQAEAARREAEIAEERVRRVKLTRWAMGVVLFGASVLAASELLLARKERTLHRSYALAAETQVAFQPQFAGFEAMQPPLLSSLMGTRFLDDGNAKILGPAQLPPINLLYVERLAGLRRTELLSQLRNISSLRTVLQGSAWLLPGSGSAAAFEAPIARPEARPCVSVRAGAEDRSREFEGANFFARPAPDGERGLIVTAAGPDGISVYAGRMPGGATQCEVDFPQLISTPPLGGGGARVNVGLASDLSNLLLYFPDSVQFHAVLWADSKGVQLRPRAVVVNPDLGGWVPAGPVTLLASGYAPFATDIRLGPRRIRLFDPEPTPIADAQARQATALGEATAQSVCAAFAAAVKADATKDERVFATPPGVGAKWTHCLYVKPAQGAPLFLATLYAFHDADEARNIDKQAPLVRDLVLGAVRPTEFRIDTAAGWLAVRGDGRAWRAVPWSVPALRGLAKAVFVPNPPGSEPWDNAGLWKLIVGDEGGGAARVPEWLATEPEQPRKTAE